MRTIILAASLVAAFAAPAFAAPRHVRVPSIARASDVMPLPRGNAIYDGTGFTGGSTETGGPVGGLPGRAGG